MEIQDIIQLQQIHHLTDGQFAQKLGVYRETWNKIKKGKRPLNDKFIMRVYRAFPYIFLPPNATTISKVATPLSTDTRQMHQNGILARLWGLLRKLYWWIAPIR